MDVSGKELEAGYPVPLLRTTAPSDGSQRLDACVGLGNVRPQFGGKSIRPLTTVLYISSCMHLTRVGERGGWRVRRRSPFGGNPCHSMHPSTGQDMRASWEEVRIFPTAPSAKRSAQAWWPTWGGRWTEGENRRGDSWLHGAVRAILADGSLVESGSRG